MSDESTAAVPEGENPNAPVADASADSPSGASPDASQGDGSPNPSAAPTADTQVPATDAGPEAPTGDGSTPPVAPTADSSQNEEDFRAQQKLAAEAQNQTADNAVPEQRPQASQQVEATTSPLTQRLIDEGAIPDPDAPPMGKEAYDAAADPSRQEETATQGRTPAPHVGTVIRVLSGPHRDRKGAVVRVLSYPTLEDRVTKEAGTAASDYVQPEEIEVTFRGDDRDGERVVLNLTEVEFELIPSGFAGRAAVSGSL